MLFAAKPPRVFAADDAAYAGADDSHSGIDYTPLLMLLPYVTL